MIADQERVAAEESLRQALASLPIEEILHLCYFFKTPTPRLIFYLDALRQRSQDRAQFASCLICFDLARRGLTSFQQEFVLLAPTMRELGKNHEMVHALIDDDPYLQLIWQQCQKALVEMDPRFPVGSPPHVEAPSREAQVALLSDTDFSAEQLPTVAAEPSELNQLFAQAVETFLGGRLDMAVHDPTAGFRLRTRADTERFDNFIAALESLSEVVPLARGYRALVLLFYGASMRSHNLFGTINQRKQLLLRHGLQEFSRSSGEVCQVVAVLDPLHAEETAWSKIAAVISDFCEWLYVHPEVQAPAQDNALDSYDAVARLAERTPKSGERRLGLRT